MTVVACGPARHLAVAVVDDYGSWRLDADLVEADGVTVLITTTSTPRPTRARSARGGVLPGPVGGVRTGGRSVVRRLPVDEGVLRRPGATADAPSV